MYAKLRVGRGGDITHTVALQMQVFNRLGRYKRELVSRRSEFLTIQLLLGNRAYKTSSSRWVSARHQRNPDRGAEPPLCSWWLKLYADVMASSTCPSNRLVMKRHPGVTPREGFTHQLSAFPTPFIFCPSPAPDPSVPDDDIFCRQQIGKLLTSAMDSPAWRIKDENFVLAIIP